MRFHSVQKRNRRSLENNYFEPDNIKIKNIHKKTEFSIDIKLVNFVEWFASYNLVPIGLVLKMVIGDWDE